MLINENKQIIQDEALKAIEDNNHRGIIAIATGGGKSKIVIDYLKKYEKDNNNIILVVPTEKLRDREWENEFSKWNAKRIYKKMDRYCYVSINKLRNKKYDTVILDEGQHITPANSEFFKNNECRNIIMLSATPPEEKNKVEILKSLNLDVIYQLGVDDAVTRGVIAPYEVVLIGVKLDNKDKYIKTGGKGKYWYVTEEEYYISLSARIIYLQSIQADGNLLKAMYLKRMRFIYNLRTKKQAAKYLLDKVIPKEDRTLIFAGSIKMAESLEKNSYNSKSNDDAFNKFVNGEINRLSSVVSLNVGINIPNLDNAFVVQSNNKERNLIQRMGRVVRYRHNHKAHIYILYVKDTVDEVWTLNSIKSLDTANIKTVTLNKL